MNCEFSPYGAVVRSLAGRDRYRLYCIVDVCNESGSPSVMIADGKLHLLSRPKKKNLRHLAVLAAAPDGETSYLCSDSALSDFLEDFEERTAQDRNNAQQY